MVCVGLFPHPTVFLCVCGLQWSQWSCSPSFQVEVDELQSRLAQLRVEEGRAENSIGSLHSQEREVRGTIESLRAEVGRLATEETRYSMCYMYMSPC